MSFFMELNFQNIFKVVIEISRFDKAYMRSYKINPQSEKEFFDCISDIYFTDEVQGLAVYEQHLDINRLQHITSVAYLSYLICKKIGLELCFRNKRSRSP